MRVFFPECSRNSEQFLTALHVIQKCQLQWCFQQWYMLDALNKSERELFCHGQQQTRTEVHMYIITDKV